MEKSLWVEVSVSLAGTSNVSDYSSVVMGLYGGVGLVVQCTECHVTQLHHTVVRSQNRGELPRLGYWKRQDWQ